MTIKELLEFLFTRGLPMVGVYWLLERPFLQRWLKGSEGFFKAQLGLSLAVVKRALAMLLSVGLSLGAFAIYYIVAWRAANVNYSVHSVQTIPSSAIGTCIFRPISARDFTSCPVPTVTACTARL